jgi:hypothetical protein
MAMALHGQREQQSNRLEGTCGFEDLNRVSSALPCRIDMFRPFSCGDIASYWRPLQLLYWCDIDDSPSAAILAEPLRAQSAVSMGYGGKTERCKMWSPLGRLDVSHRGCDIAWQ